VSSVELAPAAAFPISAVNRHRRAARGKTGRAGVW
jgi:hypothetical protein